MTGKVKLVSAGGGSVSLATPSTGSNRTVTLPDADLTIPVTNSSTTLTTQGDILYRDGSGIQRLPKGAAGKVLKMNSGATAPEWGTDVGGSLVFVGEQTLSGSTDTTINVEDTVLFDGTYDQVLIRITDHHPNTDESIMAFRVKHSGSYQTGSHYLVSTNIFYEDSYDQLTAASTRDGSAQMFQMGKQIGNAAGENYSCDLWIDSPASTANYKMYRWYPTYIRTAVQAMGGFGHGFYTNSSTGTTALQGIQIMSLDSSASAAQIKDIKIRKYGFKKS